MFKVWKICMMASLMATAACAAEGDDEGLPGGEKVEVEAKPEAPLDTQTYSKITITGSTCIYRTSTNSTSDIAACRASCSGVPGTCRVLDTGSSSGSCSAVVCGQPWN